MSPNFATIRDYRQYQEYNSYYEKKGWLVEKSDDSFVLIRRLPIIGSIIKVKRCNPEISLRRLDELAKKYRALFIKLELNLTTEDSRLSRILEDLKRFGYERSSWNFCPTKTIYIDLTLSLETLLAQTKKDVRRYLRKSQEKNFKFRQDKDLAVFYPLLIAAGKLKGYMVPKLSDFKRQWGAYGEDLKLLLAYKNGELLGGSMTICRDEMAFGIHMALSKKGINEHLSYSLMWESIKIAKAAGCKKLDLDGIYDPRFRSPLAWQGLTRFKKKFGGREVEFVGDFIKCHFLPFKLVTKYGYL